MKIQDLYVNNPAIKFINVEHCSGDVKCYTIEEFTEFKYINSGCEIKEIFFSEDTIRVCFMRVEK